MESAQQKENPYLQGVPPELIEEVASKIDELIHGGFILLRNHKAFQKAPFEVFMGVGSVVAEGMVAGYVMARGGKMRSGDDKEPAVTPTDRAESVVEPPEPVPVE